MDNPQIKYFTPDQIFEFLDLPISTPFAAMVKAAACLSFCGQLTAIDLKAMQIQDLEEVADGLAVNMAGSRVRTRHSFVLRRNESGPCMYRPVRRYLDALGTCGIKPPGPLFRTCNPGEKGLTALAYRPQPMGKTSLYTFGRYAAEMLNLPEAEKYNTTCFKLSAKMASQS